ncbi:MAG: cysteine desulfurase family protein [Candidatus Nanoarchaeia archaeon]|nr:cysteine desulfurase family protein [Candidatus Nanoarchaeia archaeon]
MKKEIYFDNASTTPVRGDVLDAMLPYFSEKYGNPGSMHSKGLDALKAMYGARKKVANYLNCEDKEIIFTGSGTESTNLAILGFARKKKKGHVIVSAIEHHAVLHPALRLKEEGFEVTVLNVDNDGLISLDELEKSIKNNTILVSINYANNEIGTIQEISNIGEICHKHNVIFHTDACQATPYLDLDVEKLNVDMMTLNGSKLNGPKGVGVLYIKKGIELEPLIYGGGQENNLRSGTENVPLIVGFAKALEIARENRVENYRHVLKLSKKLTRGLFKIPNCQINGSTERRLPNNVNFSFLNVEGEALILLLNEEGIYVSTASACSSKSLEPSHVLMAIGLKPEVAHGSLRFTLNWFNTEEEVEYVIQKVTEVVNKLRRISAMEGV